MQTDAHHWDDVYRHKNATEVSWYRAHLETSLALIAATDARLDSAIIDVGGGASTLVDDLLAAGYQHVAVLDLAASALLTAQTRLGPQAVKIDWRVANVLEAEFAHHQFDVWHDRAVFHFLTAAEDRARYVAQVRHAVKPGGHVIVGSFGPGGPLQCSGLDVVRYSPDALHGEFGVPFELVKSTREAHLTPGGKTQEFVYCYCRKRG